MRTRTFQIIVPITILVILSLSCSLFSKTKELSQPVPTLPVSGEQEEAEPTATVSEPEDESSETGHETPIGEKLYVFDEGGFEFMPLAGWEVSCSIGIIQMKAPGADPEYGPAFLIMAGDNPDEMTTEQAFEKFKEQSTAAKIDAPETAKVGGFPGLKADLTNQQGGKEIRGTVITSMLTAYRQFTMMAFAPDERWDEIDPYFESVLGSIRFIAPVANAGCPGEGGSQESVEVEVPEVEALPSGNETLHQWAISARASSEYGEDSWSADQATGEPDATECGDSVFAWASLEPDGLEWLELTYTTPVYPTSISIYMNYNPSQVYEVQVIDVNGNAYTVIETEPEYVEYCPDVYEITLDLTKPILANQVRILVDQSILGLGWTEIDAVELVGTQQPGGVNTRPGDAPAADPSKALYQPGELDPGAYVYAVSGYENDEIIGANVQYQSTDHSYVVGLISSTERYIVSLFLPKSGMKQGITQLIPYEKSFGEETPTAAIYISAFLYVADSGQIDLTKDPTTGKLTGTFSFKAHSKDFPDRNIEVSGAVNDIPLR